MSKFKKVFSFIFLGLLLIATSLISTNFNFTKKIYAENDSIVLSVNKVAYNNLSTLEQEELYTQRNTILSTSTSISDGSVVSLNSANKEGVFVTLMSNQDQSNVILILNPSLTINGQNVSINTYNIGQNNSENHVFLLGLDFADGICKNLESAYVELTFNYSYTTTGSNAISEVKTFSFYMINHDNYLTSANLPNLTNANDNSAHSYYYWTQSENKPTLHFNPLKYSPTIVYTYNQTYAEITTQLINNNSQLEINSTNEFIFKNSIIDLNETNIDENGKVSITFNSIGNYAIKYNLVIKENNVSYKVINDEASSNITEIKEDNLYFFGVETYYKDYLGENYTYKPFFNELYTSNFSYMFNNISTNAFYNYFNNTLTNENKIKILNSMSSTNQAPIELHSLVGSFDDNGSIYYKLVNKDGTLKIEDSTSYSFITNKKFDEEGIYALVIPYNYTIVTETKQYVAVIIFKIENTTPNVGLYTNYANENKALLPTNNFTNQKVTCVWANNQVSSFYTPAKISFTRNGEDYTRYNLVNNTTDKLYEATFEEDGTYNIQIAYGINNQIKIEKTFTIDSEEISYQINLANLHQDNGSYYYTIGEKVNNFLVNNNFAIFTKAKTTKNTISIKYDYITIEKAEISNLYSILDNKLYLYSDKEFASYYNNLQYENTLMNSLTDFNNITLENNSNAVINTNGLYHFSINDLAGNTKSFYILLDNTAPIVLQTNALAKIGATSLVDKNDVVITDDKISKKSSGINIVNDDYSLIFGNAKLVRFATSENVTNFLNNFVSYNSSFGDYIKSIDSRNYFSIPYSSITYPNDDYTSLISGNILQVDAPEQEIERIYKITSNMNGITYSHSFDLNTDKSQILIYGYDNKYYRIYSSKTSEMSNITNSNEVYIRYINNTEDEKFELYSLKVYYYPYIVSDGIFKISSEPAKDFNILSPSISSLSSIIESEANLKNGVVSGGYMTSLLNPTYLNDRYVTEAGKYVIEKIYVGDTNAKYYQTFYVDRYLPIEKYDSNYTIGHQNSIILNDATLTANNILYYILNETSIDTNKLPITFNLSNFKYLESEVAESDLNNFKIFYQIHYGTTKIYDSSNGFINLNYCEIENNNTVLLKTGQYTISILDYAGYYYNDNENINANIISFEINLTNEMPSGSFTVNENQQLDNNASTNTNSVQFNFTDSASEYLYDVDIENIKLYYNGSQIFNTTSTNTGYYLNISSSEKVYYQLSSRFNKNEGVPFTLTKTLLASTKVPNALPRYSYTLTILDANKLNSFLYTNGISNEGVYTLVLTYKNAQNYLINDKIYITAEYSIIIDHTAPYKNVQTLIDADNFLTSTEKLEMKNSVANKDRTSSLNFDNYAFIVKETEDSINFPLLYDSTDTKSIYIRKYDKYQGSNLVNNQSLVIGDPYYSEQDTTRYKFDVNALGSDNKNLYTLKSYNIASSNLTFDNFFNLGEGYYEIIEIDEAGNFTIYTVLYLKDYSFQIGFNYIAESNNDFTKFEDNEVFIDYTAKSNTNEVELIVNGNGFNLSNISTETNKTSTLLNSKYDYFNVNLNCNGEVENLRYFPIEITDSNYRYFTNFDNLINYINNKILTYADINTYGNVYTISFNNPSGEKISLINNTPKDKLSLIIIDFSDRFTVTIPPKTSATYIEQFNVYPVIDGKKLEHSLTIDSTGKTISKVSGETFTFTKNATVTELVYNEENESSEQTSIKEVFIYYLEWIDNFGRTQTQVKTLGITDYAQFDFGNTTTLDLNGNKYSANKNVTFNYQTKLYSIEIYYSLLPNTIETKLELDTSVLNKITDGNGIAKLNLLSLIGETYDNYQIKFNIKLTKLTTLTDESPEIYEFGYVYYPLIPELQFTDSSSNSLRINVFTEGSDYLTISTSKNVSVTYINSTLFNVILNATRTYKDSNGVTQTEDYRNLGKEYTFSKIGDYTVTIQNDLDNILVYKFTITNANSKMYAVYTNENNMTNYEIYVSDYTKDIDLTYNEENITGTFEYYFTIYNTRVEVNNDFNLKVDEIEVVSEDENEFKETKLYVISKVDTSSGSARYIPYKYIAIKKIDYNSNFLNFKQNNEKILIFDTQNLTKDTAQQVVTVDDVNVLVPKYNSYEGNKINITIYFNNKLLTLNSNIYKQVKAKIENGTYVIAQEGETDVAGYEDMQLISLINIPSGTYNIYFEDIAGNIQLFNGNTFLSVVLLNEVSVSLNNENPIDYQIYNSTVSLKILQERQYNTGSLKIKAYKNGTEIKLTKNASGEYIFNDYGFYKVIVEAKVGTTNTINKTIYFTILNNKEALKEYSFTCLNGQNIVKITKDGQDITNNIKSFYETGTINNANLYQNMYLYDLNLASTLYFYKLKDEIDNINDVDEQFSEDLLDHFYSSQYIENKFYDSTSLAFSGKYEITVETRNTILDKQTFTFSVWIRSSQINLRLLSSIDSGKSTTKAITFTYNPYLIYSQIGECAIYENDTKIIEINENSVNEVKTYTIPRSSKGTYIVQLKSNSGNSEISYLIVKKEPLSTLSIVIIVISSIVVLGVVFLFIKLRTKIKIK